MNVLITGGASGLGEAITIKLAGCPGWKVYFTYCRSSENAERLQNRFPNTEAYLCDFREREQVTALCNKLSDWDLDVLIHNAYTGTYIDTHFHKTELPRFQEDFENNILPVIELTQALIPLYRKRKQGRIITVLSAALLHGPAVGTSVYLAGKAYLESLAKIWAVENERFNISSVLLCPGFMQTALTAQLDERLLEQLKGQEPLGRFLSTEEVAEVVLDLCITDRAINGATVEVQAGPLIKVI